MILLKMSIPVSSEDMSNPFFSVMNLIILFASSTVVPIDTYSGKGSKCITNFLTSWSNLTMNNCSCWR